MIMPEKQYYRTERLVRLARSFGVDCQLLDPAQVTVSRPVDELAQIAQDNPIDSIDSFFGREHTAAYADKVGRPWKDISLVFSRILEAPPRVVFEGARSTRVHKRTWEDCFPTANIRVQPRTPAGLPELPRRLKAKSRGPQSPENTRAIDVRSMHFLSGQPDFLTEEVMDFGPKRVAVLQELVEVILKEIHPTS